MDSNEINKILKNDIDKIRNKLIHLLIDFGRKDIDLVSLEHPKFRIRESIIYRLNSIIYHQQLLISEFQNYQIVINDNSLNVNTYQVMINASFTIHYLFDDIIFNIISLYDYISNLISIFYFKNNIIKCGWNKMIKTIRNNKSIINNDTITNSLLHYDKIIVNHLYKYRSELIHYQKDESELSIHDDSEKSTLIIKAPKKILSIVKFLKQVKDIEKYSIYELSYLLIDSTLKQIDELMDNLTVDIIPKTKNKITKIIEDFKKNQTNY